MEGGDEMKRTKVVVLKLTEEEKQRLEKMAEKREMTVSTYVRQLILEKYNEESK
jgi:predicted DNA-binding protein